MKQLGFKDQIRNIERNAEEEENAQQPNQEESLD